MSAKIRSESAPRPLRRGNAGLGTLALALWVAVAVLSAPPTVAAGRTDGGQVNLEGEIESLPATPGWVGDWRVAGVTVRVTAATQLVQGRAMVAVGARAAVQARARGDGSVVAARVEVRQTAADGGGRVEFFGTVATLPGTADRVGDWTVGTMTVHVGATTVISQDGTAVAVGATVHVVGELAADGSVNATAIQVKMPPPGASGSVALCGVVTALPPAGLIGDWQVGRTTVHVVAATVVDQQEGGAAVGVTARVRGAVEDDGSITAAEVEVQAGGCGEAGGLTSSLFAVLHLTATTDAPLGAEGVVVTRHFTFADGSDRQDFKVGVEGLLPATAYEVVVDTVSAGVITTNDEGEGHLFLSTAGVPGAGALPAALQPVEDLKQVSVNAPSGTAVLMGAFADAVWNDHENQAADYLAAAVLTSGLPGVVGIVAATIKDGEQSLSVGVWGLTSGADYDLVIDGTALATLTASEAGRIHAEFSSVPGDGETALPDALLPVSALLHADLLDQGGNTVASGDFRSVSRGPGAAVQRLVKRKLGH